MFGIQNGETIARGDWFTALLEDGEYEQYNKLINNKAWLLTLLQNICSMFVREGLPDSVDPRIIEPVLLLYGCGAYVKEGEKLIYGICQTCGEPNRYYIGKDAIVMAGGGYCEKFEDWENNENIVVCWNTPNRLPDLQIFRTADNLTEIDTSLMCNLIYSRLYPIAVADDDKTLVKLQKLFEDMLVGKFGAITSSNILNVAATGKEDPGIGIVNITDVAVSDKIQYLAKYHDDVLRWFYSFYGQNVQATSKLAQESVAESTSGEGVSMILPHTMYHERQRECEQLQKKFGLTVTCEFSEPWQNSFADCVSEDGTEATAEEEEEKGVDNESNNDSSGNAEEGSASDNQ